MLAFVCMWLKSLFFFLSHNFFCFAYLICYFGSFDSLTILHRFAGSCRCCCFFMWKESCFFPIDQFAGHYGMLFWLWDFAINIQDSTELLPNEIFDTKRMHSDCLSPSFALDQLRTIFFPINANYCRYYCYGLNYRTNFNLIKYMTFGRQLDLFFLCAFLSYMASGHNLRTNNK